MKKVFFSFLFILSPFLASSILACQCEGLPTIYQAFNNSTAVFTGKVTNSKIIEDKEKRVFSFEVVEAFKGVSAKQKINITTLLNMCESGFEVGSSYLIYASSDNENSFYTMNFCSRNEGLEWARDQIYYIKELLQGKPEAQIYGTVARFDGQNTNRFGGTPLENVKIVVEGKGKRFQTFTDKKGFFRLNKIAKGKYTIKTETENIYTNAGHSESQEIVVLRSGKVVLSKYLYSLLETFKDEKDFEAAISSIGRVNEGVYIEFNLRRNNTIKGKVLDFEGKPIENARVRLVPESNPLLEINSNNYSVHDGNYWIGGITPGRYFLVVDINAPFADKNKNKFFCRHSENPEKAILIDVKEIENLNLDFKIPLIQRKIVGKVLWSDETLIIGDVKVVLAKTETLPENEIRENNYDVTSLDGASYFSLNGFLGAEYWVHVFVFAEKYINEEKKVIEVKVKPVKFKVEEENKPLKILIPKPSTKLF